MKTKTEVKKMNIDIANRLYELRKKSSLSQEDLAEKIGVSRQAVSKWERAEASPDTDNLILLAKLYDVSLDELLSTEEPVEKTSESFQQQAEPEKKNSQYNRYEENDYNEDHDDKSEDNFWLRFRYPLFVTIIYLCLGFAFDIWHPAWILFVTIPIFYSIVGYTGGRRGCCRKK